MVKTRTVREDLAERYSALRLVGRYQDALGEEHEVEDRADIRETWTLRVAAQEKVPVDYEKRIADVLKKVEQHLGKIEGHLRKAQRS